MKRTIFFVALVCFPIVMLAGSPEHVFPKTKVIMPVSWYAQQALLWEAQVQQHKTDAAAWMNYYTASRYAQRGQDNLDGLVEAMRAAVPDSYEFYLLHSLQQGYTPGAYASLMKALTLKPDRPAAYAPLVLFNEYYGNSLQRKEFSRKLFASDQISASLLNYSYNVLMSVEPAAVLITEGENTSLPLFVLQDVLNVRPDVKVISLDLALEPAYRQRMIENLKLSWDGSLLTGDDAEQKRLIAAMLPAQNPAIRFYYTLTVPQESISNIKDQLYVVGLASQLSKERLDNIATIRENLEKRFLLDHLTVDFNGENEFASGKVLSANYLVPMLMLYEHYINTGAEDKADLLAQRITRIAQASGKDQLVANFMNRRSSDAVPFVPFHLDVKATEGKFRPINQKLYAQESEVTNEQYNIFLNYLLQNNFSDQYAKYAFDLSQYTEPALSFMKNYTSWIVPTKKNKYFTQYPAVSMSYEGALAYCEWLTEQYNNTAERKFKKVKFRLPSLDEWQIAAASIKNPTSWKLDDQVVEVRIYPSPPRLDKNFKTKKISLSEEKVLYPWFRFYHFRNTVLNHMGCSLGNFKFPETQKPCRPEKMNTPDGFMLMSAVESYFPNDIGLFDVVGNVAEMIDEKGKACGGSWNQSPEESTIRSVRDYEAPDAATGFRVFMEVIEP